LVRICKVEPLGGFRVRLHFAGGTQKEVDLGVFLHGPIFAKIRTDPSLFRSVHLVGSTIGWDNGADIDPDVLYYDLKPAWMDTEPELET
jgi:Protein of unknown function (DUF2442)